MPMMHLPKAEQKTKICRIHSVLWPFKINITDLQPSEIISGGFILVKVDCNVPELFKLAPNIPGILLIPSETTLVLQTWPGITFKIDLTLVIY